jgi:hypothetical protein
MVAGPEVIPTDLTLEIGADLSPDRFMALARAFFGYVQEISESFAPEGNVPQWIVRVRDGSTLLDQMALVSALREVKSKFIGTARTSLARIIVGPISRKVRFNRDRGWLGCHKDCKQ